MRMRGAQGIRPGSGKGQAVRCQRAVPVTRAVLGGMGLTASPCRGPAGERRWSAAGLGALPARNDHDREGRANDGAS
jgi:hypothetical protein